MVDLTPYLATDPTLKAMEVAAEENQGRWPGRGYLGMSSLGHDCDRWLWLTYHWCIVSHFDAATLWRFEDGHRTEDLIAERLSKVPGVMLITEDPGTGGQIGFVGVKGQLRGHADGMIIGLHQAPTTWHVWENKSVGDAGFTKLEMLKAEHGEKCALLAWNPTYWAQAQLYMNFGGVTRSYHTVTTPGGRRIQSIRTDYHKKQAGLLVERAERLVAANMMPAVVSTPAIMPPCVWCSMKETCHEGRKMAIPRSCRSCAFSTPAETDPAADEPLWHCHHHKKTLTRDAQIAACGDYTMHPDLEAISCA